MFILSYLRMRVFQRNLGSCQLLSRIFQPVTRRVDWSAESDRLSKSHRLLVDLGLVEHSGASGLHCLLPLALRSLKKLTDLVDGEMEKIGAQKILCPILAQKHLWEKAGRWDLMKKDMFTLRDRNDNEFCLSPTHEEAVTNVIGSVRPHLPAKKFPLFLYQISEKYRDEQYPRFGLLRARSFLMKDLYSFDVNLEASMKSYGLLLETYKNIIGAKLGLEYYFVKAASGKMGGDLSHEFHLKNPAGQDLIRHCEHCNTGVNTELLKEDANQSVECKTCARNMGLHRTVEVAHTFLLETKYSSAFEACYKSSEKLELLQMGCFGIGLTRLLAAAVDEASDGKESEIRWPIPIAPYRALIIPPKDGSREAIGSQFVYDFAEFLSDLEGFKDDVIIDDRTNLTVGRRLFEAKQVGYPFIVVGAKSVVTGDIPKLELINLNNDKTETLCTRSIIAELSSWNTKIH